MNLAVTGSRRASHDRQASAEASPSGFELSDGIGVGDSVVWGGDVVPVYAGIQRWHSAGA